MKKFVFVAALAFAVSIAGVSHVAHAGLSDAGKEQITNLNKELNALDGEFASLQPAYSSLVEEKKRLSDVDELLKGAIARYRGNMEEHNRKVAEHQSTVAGHNSRCSGSFSDRSYVNACNAEADRLDAWKNQLNDEVETGRQMKRGLQERVNGLSQATLEWTQKVKSYDAKRNDLLEKRQNLISRINDALEDLKRREKLSVSCSGMNSLESAHACLQRVWDGAK